MQFPVVTNELAQQIAQSEIDYMVSMLMSMQKQPGNPFGVEIRHFGSTTGFLTREIEMGSAFNRVMGLGPQDEELIDDILHFCRKCSDAFRIEISPHQVNSTLLARLTNSGLYQSGFGQVLYGRPQFKMPSPPTNITIRKIDRDELDDFVDVYTQGFGQDFGSEEVERLVRMSAKALHRVSGWHFYLAFVDNIPGGMGILYIQDDIASLVAAATIPSMRGKGCQTAVLHRRIADAAEAGCRLVVAQTGVNTVSQHNMERVGLRIAYTKAIWQPV